MASKGVNKVILIGNLGGDPQIRYMPNGSAVANITIATSETWRDKQTGQQREKTEWHRVVVFGKTAEVAGEYLKKGSQVYVEGQLVTRKWQDQNGKEQYTTEIVVQGYKGVLQMLGRSGQSGGQPSQNQPQQNYQHPAQQQQTQYGQQTSYPMDNGVPPADYDDDIPFRQLGHQPHMHLCM